MRICCFAVNQLKQFLGYDDTLYVFGIHGIGGIFGAIMTGVFATSAINPIFKDAAGNSLPVGFIDGNSAQIFNQLIAAGLTIAFAAVGSFIILKIVDLIIGLRVSEEGEFVGLDVTQHGETAYVYAITTISGAVQTSSESFEESGVIASTELAYGTNE